MSAKSVKLGCEYRHELFLTRSNLDIGKTALLTTDAVIGWNSFLFGGEFAVNVRDNRITKYALAAAYRGVDYDVTLTGYNGCSVWSAAYHHRVNKDLEAGAKTTWDSKNASAVGLEVGTKYALDQDAFVKVRLISY